MSEQVRLAKVLAALGPERLAALLARLPESNVEFDELLELAEFLLRPKALATRLAPLPRSAIEALLEGDSTETLIHALLADEAGGFESARLVASKLLNHVDAGVLSRSGSGREVSSPLMAPSPAGEMRLEPDFLLTAQALAQTVLALRELILSADRHWLRAMRNGLRKPDAVAFSEYIHFSPEEIQTLFALAVSTGLIVSDRDRWVPSARGRDWIAENATQSLFWIYSRLEPDFSQLIGIAEGELVTDWLRSRFPISDPEKNRVVLFGDFLALTESGRSTAILVGMASGASHAVMGRVDAGWPVAATKIIIQADQSLTIPGPLSPELHVELSKFADPLDIGLASRFRLTQMSVCRGLETGLTKEQIGDRLVELSGSTLPQPVQYVLDDAARRLQAIKIRSTNFGTEVSFEDRIESIKVEREKLLHSVGLFRIDDLTLGSRLKPDLIWLALQEAGYPASRVPAESISKDHNLNSHYGGSLEFESNSSRWHELAEKLLASGTPSADEHHLLRQLQSALKNKIPVTLTIQVKSGGQISFTAIVTSVSDTRVRLRDYVADTERTIPIAAIVDWALG